MAALGHGLVVAAPGRPGQDLLNRGKHAPDDTPQEAPHFRHGEGDQLGEGEGCVVGQRRGQRPSCARRC